MLMKGAGDEYFGELVLPKRHAIFGMGSVAFPLAGNCARRIGRGGDGIVPWRLVALSVRHRNAGVDAAGSDSDFFLLFAAAFCWGRNCQVVAERGLSVADSGEENLTESLGSTFFRRALARCA